MTVELDVSTNNRYLTCAQWCEEYDWPPIGGLRHLIFHANSNGFDKVVRRIGRRVLLSEADFLKYIEEHSNNAQSTTN